MTKPQTVRGVLFDLDGVLIDSARAWFETIKAGSDHPERLTFDDFLPTFGQGPEADRQAYFPGWTEAAVSRFYLDTFPQQLDNVALMPGAHELLARLRDGGLRLAVVTNTPRPLAEAVLTNKAIAPLIDTLAAAGDAAEKPEPDLIFRALATLGLSANEVVYVGDSPSDLAATRTAGVYMIGLDADGDETISELGEVVQRLGLPKM